MPAHGASPPTPPDAEHHSVSSCERRIGPLDGDFALPGGRPVSAASELTEPWPNRATRLDLTRKCSRRTASAQKRRSNAKVEDWFCSRPP
jgi:hypothetical protein